MQRPYNFSSGPAMLPEAVLDIAQQEMLSWRQHGESVMEMSHRGALFSTIMSETRADLLDLLGLSDSGPYEVLFLPGGASLQFEMLPMNLLSGKGRFANYAVNGTWGQQAFEKACLYGTAKKLAHDHQVLKTVAPTENYDDDATYFHYTANETIAGIEFDFVPKVPIPLVCDMSSNFLSRPIEIDRYSMIYASAQKNFGIAGLCLVLIHRDFLKQSLLSNSASWLSYPLQVVSGSMKNTPPCYAIYMAGLMFKWLKQQGGVAVLEKQNIKKAQYLYDYLDSEPFYQAFVDRASRSRMNVVFQLADESLNDSFLSGASSRGLMGLKGHRSVGGMRASIYNAMPLSGLLSLVDYLKDFARHRA